MGRLYSHPMKSLPQRATLLAALAAMPLLLATIGSSDTSPLHSRRFEFHYTGTLDPLPPGASRVELWVPYPQDDEHQTVSAVRLTGPGKFEVTRDPVLGNQVAHLVVDHPQGPV